MLRQMERIGLPDTPANRQHITKILEDAYHDPSNVARTLENGNVVKETLVMGPRGGVKMESYWDPDGKLMTIEIFGGGKTK